MGTTIKNTRSSVLRERCQAALGFHFPEVYAYLKRTRNQEQATGARARARRTHKDDEQHPPWRLKSADQRGVCGMSAALHACADEMQVQKQLQELVGGDRTLLQGCFLVDQLVFQEMMT